MLTVTDAGRVLNITGNRVKQIATDKKWPLIKTSRLRVPPSTMRNLIKERELEYANEKVVIIATEKGGTGKTFLTTSAAVMCSALGLKTLVIDIDPEACATNTLLPDDIDHCQIPSIYEVIRHGVPLIDAIQPTKYDGLFIVPSKAIVRRTEKHCHSDNPKYLIKNIITQIYNDFDLIFFDLPPSFSNLVASCYLASNLVVQPCEPTVYGEESIQLTTEDIKEVCNSFDCTPPKNVILINYYRDGEIASAETRRSLESRYPDRVLPFCIRKSQDVINLINAGQTILDAGKLLKADLELLVDYLVPLKSNLKKPAMCQ